VYLQTVSDYCGHKLILSSSEKAPGMFGTLVISLPSKHCGGAVELSHSGEKLVLKTDVDSDNNLTYMAWFVQDSGGLVITTE
jgi:hypothetical protein